MHASSNVSMQMLMCIRKSSAANSDENYNPAKEHYNPVKDACWDQSSKYV